MRVLPVKESAKEKTSGIHSLRGRPTLLRYRDVAAVYVPGSNETCLRGWFGWQRRIFPKSNSCFRSRSLDTGTCALRCQTSALDVLDNDPCTPNKSFRSTICQRFIHGFLGVDHKHQLNYYLPNSREGLFEGKYTSLGKPTMVSKNVRSRKVREMVESL